MSVQISIIGLGRIGASFGLALAGHSDKVLRIGHDRDLQVLRKARALGAADRLEADPAAAVEGAEIILLALPQDEIGPTLKAIADSLQPEAVLLDTAPVKSAVWDSCRSQLPGNTHYAGLIPACNPAHLAEEGSGIDFARADLFARADMGICTPPGTAQAVVKLAGDLAALVGASPFYLDLEEADGMLAATHLLPALAAHALLQAVCSPPGWRDRRRLAGRPFLQAGAAVESGGLPASLAAALHADRPHVRRVLKDLRSALDEVGEALEDDSPDRLEGILNDGAALRSLWLRERLCQPWREPAITEGGLPKSSDIWRRLIGDLPSRLSRRGH